MRDAVESESAQDPAEGSSAEVAAVDTTVVPADSPADSATGSVDPAPTTVEWAPDDAALSTYVTLARAALLDMTEAATIGEPAGHKVEADRVVSVYFHAEMTGYPGWRWTVSIAHLDDAEPNVLETELTPGDGALLAPDWTPWVDRLADYNAAQDALAETADDETDDPDADDADLDDSDDEDEDDDADLDDDESDDAADDSDGDEDEDDDVGRVRSLLHAGDLDGVDIDDLDEAADEATDEVDDADGVSDAGVGDAGSASESVDVDESGDAESDTDSAGDEYPGSAGSDDRPREDQ